MTTAVKTRYRFDEEKHVHYLDDKPLVGTSTSLKVMAKDLVWWASGMACEQFGWKNAKSCSYAERLAQAGKIRNLICDMTNEDYLKLCDKAYSAHNTFKNKKRDSGVDLHAEIEEFIKCRMTGQTQMFPEPRIEAFVKWADANVKEFLFSEMHCYSESLWLGGIADFGYIDKYGDYVLGDIKSSKTAYFEQWLQCALYDVQITENGGFTAKGDKVFKLKQPFAYHVICAEGSGIGRPHVNRHVERTKRAGAFAVGLYKESLWWKQEVEKSHESNP